MSESWISARNRNKSMPPKRIRAVYSLSLSGLNSRWEMLIRKFFVCALMLSTVPVSADVTLHGLFTDNMVLQRDALVPVWGTADPGERVTIEFAGQSKNATAGADGKWMAKLDPLAVSLSPQELSVSSSARNTQTTLENVLVGDVWVCGGQSNMDFPLQRFIEPGGKHPLPDDVIKRTSELVNTSHEAIRLILLDKQYRAEEQENIVVSKAFNGSWRMSASPEITGRASAVGFFFGKALNRDLGVPIGLIDSNKGGTRIELWTPAETLGMRKKPVEENGKAEGNSVLYNGMIAPLMSFAIKGVIWYQGEANAHSIEQANAYEKSLTDMISAWRENWGQGDFPFLFVQLASFRRAVEQPLDENWPVLRESQFRALALPNTGMASAIDLGQEKNIHPYRKEEVGERLALVARKVAYGENIVAEGPVFQSIEVEGDRAFITFKNTGSKLVAKNVMLDSYLLSADELKGFAICGADKKFVWADAVIKGDTVEVFSPAVKKPVAVRYAWQNFPLGNLYNTEGLPAVPFRTDNYAIIAKSTKPVRQ